MKNLKYIILFIFINNQLFAQTEFDKGFKEGYKNGYCFNIGVGCVAPVTPVAPIPKANESSSSYQNGYDRGFAIGYKKTLNYNDEAYERERYQTSEPEYMDFIYSLDHSDKLKLADAIYKAKAKMMELASEGLENEVLEIAYACIKVSPYDPEILLILAFCNYNLKNFKNAVLWGKKYLKYAKKYGQSYESIKMMKEMIYEAENK